MNSEQKGFRPLKDFMADAEDNTQSIAANQHDAESGKLRPTMQDVAEAAGVSLKTVSRVVNKEPSVTEATRKRVEDVIKSLGFRRNDLARNLRQGQASSTIGLVIEDIANPFYSQLAHGVESVARRYNHMLIISNSGEDPLREREQVNALLLRRVSGLLIVPAGADHSYLTSEMRLGTPVVFLDRPPENLNVDAILLDSYGGSYTAMEHLLHQGHRRIGLICGDPSVHTGAGRVAAYRRAMTDWGLGLAEDLLCFGCDDAIKAEQAVHRLLALPHPPTAIFATSNRISIAVLRVLFSTTHKIAFIGFDDFEMADMLPIPVTVIAHNPTEMGRQAAELLFARLHGDESPPQRIVLPTKLIIRSSSEIKPER